MSSQTAQVAVVMGSDSDWNVMNAAADTLTSFDVPFEVEVLSAHRTPEKMIDFGKQAEARGLKVIIAGAGGAAHLPGMLASVTALPVIETQAGDVSAFVPTNVISITDGQIFLETDLFNAGIRPAINAGISVSRVGGSAQTKIMKRKDTGAGVRLALAQYRELAAFAQFASDLDDATRKQLERGRLVTELMKQVQYAPMQVWEMALSLFAVNNNFMDDVDVKQALAFEKGLREFMKTKHADFVAKIEAAKNLSADDETALSAAIADFKKTGTY